MRLVAADLGGALIFIVFLIYYRIRSIVIVRKNFKRNVTLQDFAIEVTGIPETGIDEDDI